MMLVIQLRGATRVGYPRVDPSGTLNRVGSVLQGIPIGLAAVVSLVAVVIIVSVHPSSLSPSIICPLLSSPSPSLPLSHSSPSSSPFPFASITVSIVHLPLPERRYPQTLAPRHLLHPFSPTDIFEQPSSHPELPIDPLSMESKFKSHRLLRPSESIVEIPRS
ncbi:hypothetical protein ACLOJK_010177 [Asimina triloba]